MHKVIVLGAGRVGNVIARDLNDNEDIEVTIADRRKELLESVGAKIGCPIVLDNLADEATVSRLVGDYDLAIGALPAARSVTRRSGPSSKPGSPAWTSRSCPRIRRP